MTMILYAIAAAVFFAITNAISYKRGEIGGSQSGYRSAMEEMNRQLKSGKWTKKDG